MAQSSTGFCYLRFFNAYPTTAAFDLYMDDALTSSFFLYEDFTKYFLIPSGKHTLKLTPHKKTDSLYEKKFNLQKEQIYTGILAPPLKNEGYHVFCLEETHKKLELPHFALKINQFAALPEAVSLMNESTLLPIKNLKYGQSSSYLAMKPSESILQLITASEPLLDLSCTKLKPGRLYSFYLVGKGDKAFPYKLVPSIDGFSYLSLEKCKMKTT